MSSVICLTFFDFWSHVGHGASVRVELVDFFVSGKTEVSNFQIEIVIDENVFKLQVSVDNSFALDVGEGFHHLRHEISTCVFSHSANSLTEIEEEPTSDILKQDIDKVLDFSSRWFQHVAI